jgi:hypothetical protein
MNNKVSSLTWDKEDMSANLESVLEWLVCDKRITQEARITIESKLTDEYINALLEQFFEEHNEWLVGLINDAMYDWAQNIIENQE